MSKVWLSFALISFLAGAVPAVAAVAVVEDSACRENPHDPADKGWRLSPDSGFYGQCVNARSVRPAVLIAKSNARIRFANFYHDKTFWTAEWDRADRPKVHFLVVYFEGGLGIATPAHTELMFEFPRGLRLVSADGARRASVRKVIVSWEAVFPHGVKYNLVKGFSPNYPIAGRVTSFSVRRPEYKPALSEAYRRIERYPLNFTPLEAEYVFHQSILQSASWGYKNFYHTLRPNCTTRPFDIIDLVIERTRPGLRFQSFFTETSLDPISGPSRRGLIDRGLIPADAAPIDFNAEYGL